MARFDLCCNFFKWQFRKSDKMNCQHALHFYKILIQGFSKGIEIAKGFGI